MATSDKTIREAVAEAERVPKSYKEAALSCLVEIQQTLERIQQERERRAPAIIETDKLIAEILKETQERIELRRQEIARLEGEIETLRSQLLAV